MNTRSIIKFHHFKKSRKASAQVCFAYYWAGTTDAFVTFGYPLVFLIGWLLFLIQQCVMIMANFLCTKKVKKLCKEYFSKHEHTQTHSKSVSETPKNVAI